MYDQHLCIEQLDSVFQYYNDGGYEDDYELSANQMVNNSVRGERKLSR
jgi:hypothetical protein